MCSPRIYWASVGRYTKCDYYQERMSSRWRDDAKPFSRVALFQGTPVHKGSAVTAPTARSANRHCTIAYSFLAPVTSSTALGLPGWSKGQSLEVRLLARRSSRNGRSTGD